MALKKTAGETAGTAKKTAPKAGAAKKAAPKKAAGAARPPPRRRPRRRPPARSFSDPQHAMLKKVAEAGETGLHAEKKPENKTLETLLKHKLVKKGKKHADDRQLPLLDLQGGPKHLGTGASGSSTPKSS